VDARVAIRRDLRVLVDALTISLRGAALTSEAQDSPTTRLALLVAARNTLVAPLASASELRLPCSFVLNEDYRRAVLNAQDWMVVGVARHLSWGQITWSTEWIAKIATAFETSNVSP
jgi:hypothetical protein